VQTISEQFLDVKNHIHAIAVRINDGKYCDASYLLGGLYVKCDELQKRNETDEEKKSKKIKL